jgi:hypothetical protein
MRKLLLLLVIIVGGCGKDYRILSKEGSEFLTLRQQALEEKYKIGSYPRWDWYQDTGQIVFSHDGKPGVIADIVFVGSISKESGTWLWAWANKSVDSKFSHSLLKVREFGEAHGIAELTNAKFKADASDGWCLTGISAQILHADGAYRTPIDTGYTYMLLFNVRHADKDANQSLNTDAQKARSG